MANSSVADSGAPASGVGVVVGRPAFDERRAAAIIAEHAGRPGAMLPLLHAIQAAFGCVPEAVKPMIAAALNLSRAEVHGVVSFYHDFRAAPAGRHVIKLCRAEACQSMGSESLHRGVLDRLGIALGETTRDGQVTVEAVYCLGLCATAPAALVDGHPVGRLTAQRLDGLVREAILA